jgi:hypothetical protein
VVLGLLQSRTYGFLVSRQDFKIGSTVVIPKGSISPVWLYVIIGALFLLWFFLHIRSREKKGRAVLLSLRMFSDRAANSGHHRDPGRLRRGGPVRPAAPTAEDNSKKLSR